MPGTDCGGGRHLRVALSGGGDRDLDGDGDGNRDLDGDGDDNRDLDGDGDDNRDLDGDGDDNRDLDGDGLPRHPRGQLSGDGAGARRGLTLPAPGKINRYLRVLGPRADGFHAIETRFQFIEWADRLTFTVDDSALIRRIDRHDFALPAFDLCVRAARLLQAECPAAAGCGATITVRKTIPPGAGLGGGSSGAATTLLALNHLWRLGLSRARLAALGLKLGADVPLFVRGQAATARGIGEVLTPQSPPQDWLCICVPAVVSTARVFAEFRGDGDRGGDAGDGGAGDIHPRHPRHPRVALSGGGDAGDGGTPGNDLEAVTARIYPAVADALARLRGRGLDARMSGSGGAVFAAFATRAAAERTATALPPAWRARVTRAVNRHPLAEFLQRAGDPPRHAG